MTYHHTRSGCKRISNSENISSNSNILIIWVFTVTLTLKVTCQSFKVALWLVMMHYHTKLVEKGWADRNVWSGRILGIRTDGQMYAWTHWHSDSNIMNRYQPPNPTSPPKNFVLGGINSISSLHAHKHEINWKPIEKSKNKATGVIKITSSTSRQKCVLTSTPFQPLKTQGKWAIGAFLH